MINFTVGPVQMHEYTKLVNGADIPYFRTSEFSELMFENELLIKEFFGSDENSKVVFLTGSGTAAMEAAVINSFNQNDKILIVNGGSFGKRFVDICNLYNIPNDEIKLEYGQTLKEKHLIPYNGKGYTGFLVNMNETTTGVLYDIKLISSFCRRNNIFLIVDCISSFIADEFNMKELGVNIAFTGSQKALALPPGLAIIVLDEIAVKRAYSINARSLYLNFVDSLENMKRGQTPFTPAVSILIALNIRLKKIKENGLISERQHIVTLANDFRNRVIDIGLSLFAENMSNAVTAVKVKNGISAFKVFEQLKDKYGIFVCPNGGELAEKIFRVGHIGDLNLQNNDVLIDALREIYE